MILPNIYRFSVAAVVATLLAVAPLSGIAQVTVEKSDAIEVVDGVEYYVHTVESKQTLYSISRAYEIGSEQIVLANPGAASGLSIGQTLRIPVHPNEQSTPPPPAPSADNVQSDDEYIYHTVEQQETIFGLTQKYGVSEADLMEANPELSDGLRVGQSIKIPLMRAVLSAPEYVPPAITEHHIPHMVKKGETLWSISQMYDVSVEEIKIENAKHLAHFGTLKEGHQIRIPKEHQRSDGFTIVEPMSDGDTVMFIPDSSDFAGAFNVAIMLPFFLDINDSLYAKKKAHKGDELYRKSESPVQFYQGAMIAVDSLRKKGLSVRLFVYDTANDTARVARLLQQPEFVNMHLIIGPLYTSTLQTVIDWSRERNVPVVCPVPKPNKILLGNPHVHKVSASQTVQVEQMAAYVVRKHLGANIKVITSSDVREDFLASTFMKKCNMALEFIEVEDSTQIPGRKVMTKFYTDSLKQILDPNRPNVLVVPSVNQTYVSQLISGLRRLADTYDITVFGLQQWQQFRSIDVDYIHSVNLHIVSPQHIEFETRASQQFAHAYRTRFKTDPDKFGFLGFDVTYFYLEAMLQNGSNFMQAVDSTRRKGLANSFSFFKTGLESGLENKGVFILKYEDYQLVKVN